jgi:parallel beta-helix repeat protein
MSDAATDGGSVCAFDLYVDVGHGNDTNAGTAGSPLMTLTHALALTAADAGSCTTIHVAPGTYSAASGETFPLAPSNVVIIGDETNKGNASAGATLVTGSGGPGLFGHFPAFLPGENATIAGLKIVAPSVTPDGSSVVGVGVYIQHAGLELRNNTITASYEGLSIEGGAGGTIEGNLITANTGAGINVDSGSMKLQNNTITGNAVGLAVGSAIDLGGGALGSAGGNVISCNTKEDLGNFVPNLEVQNCFWDHFPPSMTTGAGVDIVLRSGASVVTTGGAVTASPCL